ncbi:MAG: DNA mismatch endonuclease Vsr [Flavobacteriaceae bacterium]|nr:MAG: DNA mismatch endonuclease Vsr [Flavobacteriaceae bacterium]
MDIYSSDKRKDIMSKISGKEIKPEIVVRKFLFSQGFRYRKNVKYLPGKPDIVLKKHKVIIFVNGCFWHGHNCKAGKLPSTRKEFWENKIGNTGKRDFKNQAELAGLGWKVIVIWQCELKNKELKSERLQKLVEEIRS